ncbi:MAG: hypothetical protein HKM06_07105 [Spirochaetales bacterium]|nr:hypothetical protein [Spirochaetales bacterium]
MNFDLGFFVILGLVFVILIVYRQLDKNNRSLEKIRKYADTVRHDLGTFVEERTEALKDFETELKVHDKTAVEILRRIQSVEERLLTRAPEIEELQTRLDRYAASVQDLDTLSSRVDENLARLQNESEFVDKVGRRVKLSTEQMDAIEASLVKIHDEFQAQNHLEVQSLKQEVLKTFEEQTLAYVEKINSARQQVDALKNFVEDLDERKAAFLASAQESLESQFQKHMEISAQKAQSLGLDVLQKMDERIAGLAKQAEDRLRADLAGLNNRLHGEVADMQNLLEAVKSDAAVLRAETEDESERLRDSINTATTEVSAQMLALTAQLKSDVELKIAQTRQEATVNSEEIRTELMRTLELEHRQAQDLVNQVQTALSQAKKQNSEQEIALLGAQEQRLKDYETAFGYRLQKLEEVGRDVGQLDQNLREAMERVAGRVQEDFRVFDKSMNERRVAEQAALEERFKSLQASMVDLEKELEDLKERAYDNVSEKLQGFEEEFFQDLQKRNLQMQQSFEDWQASIHGRLQDLTDKTERERLEAERVFTDNLRSRLQELQAQSVGTIEKVENLIQESQAKLSNEVSVHEALLIETRTKLKDDVLEMEKSARQKFEQEFARHEIENREAMTRLEREVENRAKVLSDTLEQARAEIQASSAATASEVTIWQTKFEQKFKELENDLGDQYRSFRQTLTDKMSALSEELGKQKDDLIQKTSDERQALKNELAQLRSGVEELENSLRVKTEAALETFRAEHDEFVQELQKKNRDLAGDIETKIRDYRTQVQDTREKAEAAQKKIFGRIEDQSSLLSINLEEIDKRQKAFIAQTKIFERADQMRQELQEAIEDLQNDLAKLEVQRKELFEVEGQITRIKKMGDEAGEKLNRFISEKKRIDVLDNDFQKILSLSQAMELRLEQVNASNDLLQDIQFKIRKLEDYSKDVETRYERLERRREVLDTTSDGVDRNFSLLEKIEKSMKSLAGELNQMPNDVEELRKRMKVLSQGKDETEQAITRLGQLDQILRDVENRISKMEEARDWIARTETRLQEANKEAEEQMRTLATLTKGSAPSGAKSKTGINADLRQTVVKLARQGWGKEEIAKATKLSLGEVELILELGPR